MTTASLILSIIAILVSALFSYLLLRDRRLERRPDVYVDVSKVPAGAESWPDRREGQYTGNEANALYMAGTIHVSGNTTIRRAGLAPATGHIERNGVDLTATAYVGDPENPDTGRRESGMGIAQIPDEYVLRSLPQPLSTGSVVLRVEHARPLPQPLNEQSELRLWVQTSEGHYFASEPSLISGERYRGPRGP